MSDPQRRPGIRGRIRSAIRLAAWAWAALWGVIAVGLLVGSAPLAIKATGMGMVAILGLGPVAMHEWWVRTHPIEAPYRPPVGWRPAHPPYSPLGRLERIGDAADQLRARGVIPPADHRAIRERIGRLTDLVVADQRSIALGGTASPVIAGEIERLHMSVLGLLDAAIDSAAVAPGDADLDTRLRHHLDALHSRGQAVGELEGRVEPGPGHPQPG